jgi:hypothetical protein
VVAFKDPILAEKMPEWSLHNSDGSIFRDKSGLAWVNPYRKEVWEYLFPLPYGFSFHFAPSHFSILRIQYTTPNPIVKEDIFRQTAG